MRSVKGRKGGSQRNEMKKVTARKRQEPFRTVTWNLAGLAEDRSEPFLACARMTVKPFASLRSSIHRCATFSCWETLPDKRNGSWKCPAIIVQNRISKEYVFQRVAIVVCQYRMRNSKRVLISAHLPTIKAPWKSSTSNCTART